MGADVLPDSRCRVARDVQRSPYGNSIPVFCANCGADCGRVVPDMMTFVFVQCDPCAEKFGEVAGLMREPDHVFYERHRQAMEDMRRISSLDLATTEGLVAALSDVNSPLAKVAREWEAAGRRGGC